MIMAAAIKRGSYKSKYAQAGPAPLASFEDLPSDEMESPNSLAEEDEEDSDPVLSTVTVNVENDVESQHTLTPCEGLFFHEGSLSSIATLTQQEVAFVSENAITENIIVPAPECKVSPSEQYSKSSWTDILRSRNRSYSPQESPQFSRKKEAKSTKAEKSGKKSKGGMLSSFLKFGDKKAAKHRAAETSSVQASPNIEDEPVTPVEGATPYPVAEHDELSFKSSGNKNRPTKIDLEPETPKTPPSLSDHLDRNLQGNTSDEIPTVSEMEESMSSESEFQLDESDVRKEEEEEHDFEAETLLAQDSVDFEDGPMLESLTISTQNWPSQPKTRSVRPRLEITTVPIERPRSTTPISCAPLEAFIQSSTPSETGAEKLKVLLPGEQFTMKLKSPKKGYPKSWQDFCEAGLHSPRLPKRSTDVTPISPHTPLFEDNWASGSEQKWETFETTGEAFIFPTPEKNNPSINGLE